MRGWALIGILFLPIGAFAQSDSTKAGFKVVFNFDARRTLLIDRTVRFYGLRIGAQSGKNILALGLYGLTDPIVESKVDIPDVGITDIAYDIQYASFIYERILLDTRKWQMSIPFAVGIGNVKTSVIDSADVLKLYAEREVVPIEASLEASYKLFYWLYLNAGVGYRVVRSNDQDIDRIYSNPTWSYGIGIKIGQLIKGLRGKRNEE